MVYDEFQEREGEIVHGIVQRLEQGNVIVELGRAEAVMPRSEQVPSERYYPGQRLRVYVSEVNETYRGPQIIVSRGHRLMLRRLLEQEVPEIYSGTVEIKAIAREGGARSKVAVVAHQPGIDPVGSCVGMRGVRIQNIVNELNGEKIDVVEWNEDVKQYVANALSPAQVSSVDTNEDEKTATVVVPERQLSLAIGKEGQNARLAAKLTGWRIDIKSDLQVADELAGGPIEAPTPAEAETAPAESVASGTPASGETPTS
jgi:N utilization substance protein A